ncbi:N-acetyl neuraminic (sialic) acid synthetase [Leptospira biflexa serovar Patoc strain 'Patoc 1 (Ames)']|uniref:Putative N-acylneuraminate-9-phosphate synthase n=1 Tax=Leptospira biflexa serovar Patoc (strain Patoc 1 / ATCC 23582 / Paris) TaxID=456481 RepID=B0SLV1_LEPBP|nr:N-acetylneuraminate synthase family protein [Leptospira biflexa]ABZ93378.1 N-acetyl neuraminic (sialic) acid synthetase [Leptospira biflexa serovar Patoc strain 'Patoc 1 (Ames)']ABZ97003.1 Putative N-acylneuraminate-9-phosphate synthase [Leptospira biflexa serovar Patoc strain 'Patoc 1 (Paris)']
MDFHIGNKTLTRNSEPYLVAEIGLNHNADLEIGKRTIEKAKESGAHAVKFQTYRTEEFIDTKNPEVKFLFDIFKQYELDEKFHREFQKTALNLGLDFFSTPLCDSAVDLLSNLNVPIFKIASGDIVNLPLLNKVIQTKKPIIVSTGAALPEEVIRAISKFQKENAEVCLLHCVSMYPTPLDKVNLQSIPYYLDTTDYVIGFSDHSDGTLASSLAIGLGAVVIEKHFTLDRNLEGPDHSISMDPVSFKKLAEDTKHSYVMGGKYGKNTHKEETSGWFYGRRSLYKQNQSVMSLRPALHTKDNTVLDSWELDLVGDPSLLPEGPIRVAPIRK